MRKRSSLSELNLGIQVFSYERGEKGKQEGGNKGYDNTPQDYLQRGYWHRDWFPKIHLNSTYKSIPFQ